MKTTKTEFRFFTILEWTQEQEYLRNQHNNGWRFINMKFPGLYHFEKCEPEDVTYQLDYNPEGIAHKAEYIQMFLDCGWEYMQDYAGYSYFRKPASKMDGTEEIFCDDDSRLDMMKRVFKHRIIPLILIFCCVIIPQMFSQYHHLNRLSGIIFTGIFTVMGIFYLILFRTFAIQFWRYRKSLK